MATKIKTGDVTRALQAVWPHVTDDMVRAAAESGELKTEPLNPLNPRSHRVYDPYELTRFLRELPDLPFDEYCRVCSTLGITPIN